MRVSYWTGWLDPLMVAVSKEVFQLLPHFPGSWAFGLSTHYVLHVSPRTRALGAHVAFYPAARWAMPLVERCFDVSHVYTGLGDWHFLRALGARPVVLTITEPGPPTHKALLEKVRYVVAETEQLAAAAEAAGVGADRIAVIHPGVDLGAFRPAPPPPGRPWKCVFASSPEHVGELHTKGIDLLLDLAAREPSLELTLCWRPFGRGSRQALHEVRRRGLANVKIVEQRIPDISAYYRSAHLTVAPFRSGGKPSPNSVLEGLAAGRPTLISRSVDLATVIAREHAGVVFEPTPDGIREGFHRLCDDYEALHRNARRCAVTYFDIRNTVAAYRRVYATVTATSDRAGGGRVARSRQ
jgi:glycosyltransferase involved in cell wall biosynthesis